MADHSTADAARFADGARTVRTADGEGTAGDTSTVEERLADLEAASDARRAELRAVLDDLPAALSRRALVAAALNDLRAAPDKRAIVTRGARRATRIPGAVVRRIRARPSAR